MNPTEPSKDMTDYESYLDDLTDNLIVEAIIAYKDAGSGDTIPAFDGADHFKKCIEALLDQAYYNGRQYGMREAELEVKSHRIDVKEAELKKTRGTE